jgi:hypothetical protein
MGFFSFKPSPLGLRILKDSTLLNKAAVASSDQQPKFKPPKISNIHLGALIISHLNKQNCMRLPLTNWPKEGNTVYDKH